MEELLRFKEEGHEDPKITSQVVDEFSKHSRINEICQERYNGTNDSYADKSRAVLTLSYGVVEHHIPRVPQFSVIHDETCFPDMQPRAEGIYGI